MCMPSSNTSQPSVLLHKKRRLVTKIASCPGSSSVVWLLLPWRRRVQQGWQFFVQIYSVKMLSRWKWSIIRGPIAGALCHQTLSVTNHPDQPNSAPQQKRSQTCTLNKDSAYLFISLCGMLLKGEPDSFSQRKDNTIAKNIMLPSQGQYELI